MSIPPQDPAIPESSIPVSAPAATGVRDAAEPVRRNSIGLWLRDLLFSAAVSLLIILFLYQPVRVEGTSMAPRLEDHDRLFINKFVYRISVIRSRRCGGVSLPARPGKELHQARDRPAGRSAFASIAGGSW